MSGVATGRLPVSVGLSGGGPVTLTLTLPVLVLVGPALVLLVLTTLGGDLGGLKGVGTLLLLSLLAGEELLGVAPEEGVDHDVPLGRALDGAAEVENLTGEHPVDEGDGLLTLVVDGDGNIDVLERGIGIAESDDGDVHVASLLDGLGIGTGISDNQQTGFNELFGDIIGQSTGGPAAGGGLGADVLGALENGTLTIGTLGADEDISGVLDGGDHTSGDLDLLPSLLQVDDVDTTLLALVGVVLHAGINVLGTEMGLAWKLQEK